MPIQRLKKFNRYTAIPNETVFLIGHSDALAIWVYLMTKPDDWVIRRADLLKSLGIGRDRYEKAVARLRELELWKVETKKCAHGRFSGREITLLAEPKCRKTHTSGKQHEDDEAVRATGDLSADSPKCGKTEVSETRKFRESHHLLTTDPLLTTEVTNPPYQTENIVKTTVGAGK